MAQAKPARGSHPHGCNANVLSIQYNIFVFYSLMIYIIEYKVCVLYLF